MGVLFSPCEAVNYLLGYLSLDIVNRWYKQIWKCVILKLNEFYELIEVTKLSKY
jgi:hypothetical protein